MPRRPAPREQKPPSAAIEQKINELLALQRDDGGWSQTIAEPHSDAFATGQTLYALALAGETAARPEIARGLAFLVATQQPDGSWPMQSRLDPRRLAGKCDAADADHLCGQQLGRAGDGAVGAAGGIARALRTGPRFVRRGAARMPA